MLENVAGRGSKSGKASLKSRTTDRTASTLTYGCGLSPTGGFKSEHFMCFLISAPHPSFPQALMTFSTVAGVILAACSHCCCPHITAALLEAEIHAYQNALCWLCILCILYVLALYPLRRSYTPTTASTIRRWTNKKPGSINGHTIEFVTVGSRTSAFVPAVQKLAESNGKASRSGHKESRSTSKIEG